MKGTRLVLADRIHAGAASATPATAANALLLRDGRVLALGRGDELRGEAGSAAVVDLRGSTLTPGLTDAHIHLLEWALARRDLQLGDCRSPAAIAARLTAAPTGTIRGGWLRGRGWNPHLWGGAYPDRAVLDAVAPDHPVALQSHDMHAIWVNSRALELAGIGTGTPDPDGGRIVRDDAGQPTGVLLDMAAQIVARRLPPPSLAEAEAALLDAQGELHRLGITGVHSFPSVHVLRPEPMAVLQALAERDQLRLRVLQHMGLDRLDEAIESGLRSGTGDDWLRIGAVKFFLDGALGSRTAWLRQPYVGSSDTGVVAMEPEAFRAAVARAAQAGISSAVHAIGDAAVDLALDVLSDPAVAGPALPHRIEHLQLCPPERFADAARAGIVCSMQPAHLITDWRPAVAHWGQERCRGAYAFASLLAGDMPTAGQRDGGTAGADAKSFPPSRRPAVSPSPSARPGAGAVAVLAFGSDAPVESIDPRLGFYAATTRQDLEGEPLGGWYPEERLEVEQVLAAYTVGPALAAGAPDLGRLTPGARADLVAWERDPLECRGRELLELKVVTTLVAGESV